MNQSLTIPQNALDRLREAARLKAATTTWKPSPGDVLEGALVGSQEMTGPFGQQTQAVIQTIEGAFVAVWLNPWLLTQFRQQGADIGDLVSLTFHGQEQGKSGKRFNRMTLVVMKA